MAGLKYKSKATISMSTDLESRSTPTVHLISNKETVKKRKKMKSFIIALFLVGCVMSGPPGPDGYATGFGNVIFAIKSGYLSEEFNLNSIFFFGCS